MAVTENNIEELRYASGITPDTPYHMAVIIGHWSLSPRRYGIVGWLLVTATAVIGHYATRLRRGIHYHSNNMAYEMSVAGSLRLILLMRDYKMALVVILLARNTLRDARQSRLLAYARPH